MVLGIFYSQLNAQTSAKFTANIQSGCAPLTVSFSDESTGNGLTYYWEFGNGNTSTAQNPEAIYYQAGKYDVTLTIKDDQGEIKSVQQKGFVEVFKAPTASFSGKPRTGCAPQLVNFTNSSTKGDGNINRYIWDFGDGNTKDGVIANPVHSYNVGGKFSVSLEVWDDNGCTDDAILVDYIEVQKSPVIKIDADERYSCTAPLTVKFENKSDFTTSNDQYYWQFGDGSTSNQENPSHQYTTSGRYNVSLRITKSNGCSSSKQFDEFIIIEELKPEFRIIDAEGCAPFRAEVEQKVNPAVKGLDYVWEFSNGLKYTGPNASAILDQPGVYTVKLSVSYNGKCKKSITKSNSIRVNNSPEASYTVSDTANCKTPFLVNYTNTSKGATKFYWQFPNRVDSLQSNPVHVFQNEGVQYVRLIVVNSGGCKDTFGSERPIYIEPIDTALFTSELRGCEPWEVSFWDSSKCIDPIVNWKWDFGDGNKGNGKQVTHTYLDSGTYYPKIVLTTESGCKDSINREVRVGVKANPRFKDVRDTLCNRQSFNFTNTTDTQAVKVDRWDWYMGGSLFSRDYDGLLLTDHDSGLFDVQLIARNNLACYDTFSRQDQVVILPPKSKIGSFMDSCYQDSIVLTNKSVGGHTFYWLDPLTGDKVTDSTIVIKPEVDDTLYFLLWTFDTINGCSDDEAFAAKIENRYKADFTISGDRCAPASLFLKNESEGDNLSYRWTERDTVTYSTKDLNLGFPGAGDYWVKLTIAGADTECRDSISRLIKITGPSVSGTVTPKGICLPFDVTMISDDNPNQFKELYWVVNGEKIYKKDRITTFNLKKPGAGEDGAVIIRLVGIDSNGCQGIQEFTVPTNGPKDFGMRVNLSVDDCSHRSQYFSVLFPPSLPADKRSDYDIVWDMGDGSNPNELYTFKHTYSGDGPYEVTLRIEDQNGCVTTLDSLIAPAKRRLTAKLTGDDLETDCPPHFVNFASLSSLAIGKISRYYWEFGDGSFSELKNPSHNYLFAGKFTVKLTIWDQWGCVDSITYPDLVIVNGPEGTYEFDKDEGCVPLEVTFKANTNGTHLLELDMGDGNVIDDQPNYVHTYNDTGRFIPLMVLSDTFGCKYIMPPYDSIYVYPYPVPDFSYGKACVGSPLQFNNQTHSAAPIDSVLWEFSDGDTTSEWSPLHTFHEGGPQWARLTVYNTFGCAKTITRSVDLFELTANYDAGATTQCLGDPISLFGSYSSDTTVVDTGFIWESGSSSGDSVTLVFDAIGPQRVSYFIEDVLGCKDTMSTDQVVVIGDTVAPEGTSLHRVSVLDDNRNLVEIAASNIPDFGGYEVYKEDASGQYSLLRMVSVRTDTVQFFSGIDTRNESVCYKVVVLNTCGKRSSLDDADRHCTVLCGVQPDTNQNRVSWTSYTGWPVDTYVIEREDSDNKGHYYPLDSLTGSSLIYIDSTVACNTEYHYRIRSKEDPFNAIHSWSDTCGARPFWENRVPDNEVVRVTVVNDRVTQLDWKSAPNPQVPIKTYLVEKSKNGSQYLNLGSFEEGVNTLTDEEVDVHASSYWYRMRVVDECLDTSGYSNVAKSILLKVDTNENDRPLLDWSGYIHWDEGVRYYEIQRKEEDGSFTSLGTTLTGFDTSYVDEISDWLLRPDYCYRVVGYQDSDTVPRVVSISNEDCAPIYSRIFIPNAFSPNDDELNEGFRPFCVYIRQYHLTIYNRWGQKVFESTNPYDAWNGTYQGERSADGVYIYLLEALGADLKSYNLKGSFHLVR
jgi:gliding motility-associated-like protein